jgi:hypothetical protein
MPGIAGKKIAWEKVDVVLTFPALDDFHPQEILGKGVSRTTGNAGRPVQMPYFFVQGFSL